MKAAACTASPHATMAALEILRAGGNAVDAAVSAAWALSVCEPSGSGLGGHTVLLIRTPEGQARVMEGYSPAPKAASPETISVREQRVGRKAAAVPSTVATLDAALRDFGTLRGDAVLAPAVRLAQEGYRISRLQERQARWVSGALRATPGTAALFLGSNGRLKERDVFRQPKLAGALLGLARGGAKDFYGGEIARSIADDMRRAGGLIDLDDLARSALPAVREPLAGHYRGHRILTAPPPAGGLQLLRALEYLESAGRFHRRNAAWYAAVAVASREAFRFREDHGDRWTAAEEPGETTHLTVSDSEGRVVALTQSVQSLYGAKVAHPELGFLYNNYLCTLTRTAGPFELRAGRVPRSNAAPTLVFRPETEGGGPLLALGAAGSRRITSSLLQTISAVIDLGESVETAVAAPRVHALLSGGVRLEGDCPNAQVAEVLAWGGGRVAVRRPRDFGMGAVHALHFQRDGGVAGGADPRRDGVFQTAERSHYARLL